MPLLYFYFKWNETAYSAYRKWLYSIQITNHKPAYIIPLFDINVHILAYHWSFAWYDVFFINTISCFTWNRLQNGNPQLLCDSWNIEKLISYLSLYNCAFIFQRNKCIKWDRIKKWKSYKSNYRYRDGTMDKNYTFFQSLSVKNLPWQTI